MVIEAEEEGFVTELGAEETWSWIFEWNPEQNQRLKGNTPTTGHTQPAAGNVSRVHSYYSKVRKEQMNVYSFVPGQAMHLFPDERRRILRYCKFCLLYTSRCV